MALLSWILDDSGRINLYPVAVLLSLLLVTFTLFSGKKPSKIVDAVGNPILTLPGDARVAKFIASAQLSEQGRLLAGDKPYLVNTSARQELVVTRPEHVRGFYKDDTSAHTKPENLNLGSFFGLILGDAVGTKDGERWKVMRKYFDPEFSYQTSRSAFARVKSGTDEWSRSLPAHALAKSDDSPGFLYDAKKSCRFLPFRLMATQLYGDTLDDQEYDRLLELNKLHEVLFRDIVLNTKLASRWAWLTHPAAFKRARRYNQQWEQFNLDLIRRAASTGTDCPAGRIFRGTEDVGGMTKTEFLHTMDEILFANIDVSAAVLYTMLGKLAAHPVAQGHLREEISSIAFREDDNAVKNYIADQNTILHRTVVESMRFSPAFAFSLPECTTKPKSIGGYLVPRDTPVVIDAGRLNTDPLTWGTSALDFCPGRFEKVTALECRYQLMRYGIGGNSGRCLGKHFADMIFKLAVVTVLQRYQIRTARDAYTDGAQEGVIRLLDILERTGP
ncbi:putative Cytochrome P450 [Seiridium cardinale]|uniref:Cytochrome P450 n=1 Tax=Seiridium cardinale TaxID=138064 RepID=A0ABR2Y898_9PEZI